MTRILIGAAWPYVNGPQHIGHLAGNLLPADIFARYHRLKGDDVLFVSGSDMHGTPTTLKAELEKVSPEVIARRYHDINKESFERLGLSFDMYTHTHTETHERTVQQIFLTLLEKRYFEKKVEESPFCPKEERFLPDRYVTGTCPHCGNPAARGDECDACSRVLEPKELGQPLCKVCGTPAIFRPSEQFYFLLPKLSSELKMYHDSVKGHWRPSVRAFTENYVAAGLKPRPITRDIRWGVPVPLEGYDEKRIYVWFEAVMGYLSASQEWARQSGDPDRWKPYWVASEPGQVYNFLGKDNITFHTVLWPAILLALGGLKLPHDVPANEFVNLGGGKMAKSKSTGPTEVPVTLPDLLAQFEPDAIRFYAAYHAPQNHDTEFNLEELSHERDQVLADQWGNLVQRVLSFARTHYNSQVPDPGPAWDAKSSVQGAKILATVAEAEREFEVVHLKEALELALSLVRESNRHFHDSKPWSKEGAERNVAVYESLWSIHALSVLLAPFLPFSSAKVAQMLGEPSLLQHGGWNSAAVPPTPGKSLGAISPLFPKERPGTTSPVPSVPALARLDIRVAEIREVQLHPNAEKLYILKVDDGSAEGRTLVAGLRAYYTPEELKGKRVAILANLEPRALRGIRSDGMILAAAAGGVVSVLRASESTPPGTGLSSPPSGTERISHDEFQRARITVEDAPAGAAVRTAAVRNDVVGDGRWLRLADGTLLSPDRPVPAGSSVS